MKIHLKKPFASNSAVEARDVRQAKRVLNRLGYYMPPKNAGNTHIPDRSVFMALTRFQKEKGLRATGEMKPGDATEKALNDAQNEQEEKGGSYIWHTMQDDKVRAGHAALEGQVFSWDSPPEGGHPGEPYNCRCWAAPEKPSEKSGPPDCREEQEAYDAARRKVEVLQEKYNKAYAEGRAYVEELEHSVSQAREELALVGFTAWIGRIPAKVYGTVAKLIKGTFKAGLYGAKKTAESAFEKHSKEHAGIKMKVDYAAEQVLMLEQLLKQAETKLAGAEKNLEECKNRKSKDL